MVRSPHSIKTNTHIYSFKKCILITFQIGDNDSLATSFLD